MIAVVLPHNGRAQYGSVALTKLARNVGQDDVVFASVAFMVGRGCG